MKKVCFCLVLISMLSCKTSGDEQARAYVEGKVTTGLALNKIALELRSENIVVSETGLQSGGNFTVSGPLLGKTFSLKCNTKIKSVSGRDGLKLSTDSLSVEFPAGATFVNNLNLILVK